jgi:hypothetical protein
LRQKAVNELAELNIIIDDEDSFRARIVRGFHGKSR